MPLIKNVEKRIWDCESFEVKIKDKSGMRDIRSDGHLPVMYPFRKAAKDDMTVAQWKRIRFLKHYPGFGIDVLYANSTIAKGNTRLGSVRYTYK